MIRYRQRRTQEQQVFSFTTIATIATATSPGEERRRGSSSIYSRNSRSASSRNRRSSRYTSSRRGTSSLRSNRRGSSTPRSSRDGVNEVHPARVIHRPARPRQRRTGSPSREGNTCGCFRRYRWCCRGRSRCRCGWGRCSGGLWQPRHRAGSLRRAQPGPWPYPHPPGQPVPYKPES